MIVRIALLLVLAASADAVAQPAERGPVDLKAVTVDRQVTSVSYCRGTYQGMAAVVPTGRVGDRAFLVFSGLEELKDALKARC